MISEFLPLTCSWHQKKTWIHQFTNLSAAKGLLNNIYFSENCPEIPDNVRYNISHTAHEKTPSYKVVANGPKDDTFGMIDPKNEAKSESENGNVLRESPDFNYNMALPYYGKMI